MQVSQFTPFSVGIAAENKPLKSKQLMVTPHEHLPFLDGELVVSPTSLAWKSVDADGKHIEGGIFTDNVVEATWLPEDSNRVTAPDIRRGERIMLYKYGDADKYYWRPLGLDDHLRKLETVVIAISANPKEGVDVLDPETCYFMELSSHTKRITLQTSKVNGEATTYKLQLDLGVGKVVLQDDLGNEFFINSVEAYLRLINTHKSHFEIDKRHIRLTAGDTIKLKAGNEISFETGGTKMTLTPGGTTLKTPSFKGTQ